GRLSSVLGLTGLAAGPLVPLVGSGLLDRCGLGTALAVLAGLLVVTVAVVSTVRPLWRVGTPDTWADDAVALAASGAVPGATAGAAPDEPGSSGPGRYTGPRPPLATGGPPPGERPAPPAGPPPPPPPG